MQFNSKALTLALGLGVLAGGVNTAQAVPVAADVVFIVDESGSMAGEHAWLSSMINSLESGLMGQGVGVSEANRYALVGYGATGTHTVAGSDAHTHLVGGSQWGSNTDFATATSGLVASGGFEDGWQAIDFFFNTYTPDANHALNVVLITDEDRDNSDVSLTYNNVLKQLTDRNALLNVVVNCNIHDTSGAASIGVDSGNTTYNANGSGGYTEGTFGNYGACFGTTESDYVDMAMATGGAAWDLNLLRAGGNTAASFTSAFVDIKVQEITTQPPTGDVPVPATIALMGLGLLGMGAANRRKKVDAAA